MTDKTVDRVLQQKEEKVNRINWLGNYDSNLDSINTSSSIA